MYISKTVYSRAERKSSFSVQGSNSKSVDETDALPFRTTLMFLGIIGALPFTWKKPHYPSLHPTKSTLGLAIAVFTIVLASSYSMFMFYAHRFTTEECQLHEKMLYVQCIIISLSALGTLSLWSDVQALRRGIIIWCHITKLYFEITNIKFIQRWHSLETLVVVFTVFFSTTIFFGGKAALPELQMSYFFAPCAIHTTIVFCLVFTLWIGCFFCLMELAEDINKEMILNIKRNALTTYKLKNYQEIWLQMRALTDVTSTFNTSVVVSVVSVEASIIFIYMFILYLKMGKYFEALPLLILVALFLFLITLMIQSTHAAIEQLKVPHSGILAEHKIAPTQGTSQRQIINMFLVKSMRSPVPTCGNFIVVNKALLISIFGTIAMHLVVLAQLTQPKKSNT